MMYLLGKIILRAGAEFFFSKHHLEKLERLNTGKPLVVCANHASAHLDGILIMIFSKRRFHVLVRADVFKKKWVANLLAKINLIPIYRIRDGFNNLEKNSETFDRCYEILKNNEAIIIFPEANCEPERALRKLHKGAAKIAMMAEERSGFKLGVEMATVGITQERITKPGGRIFLEASEPFSLKPYFDSYHQHNNRAFNDIMNDVEQDLRTVLPVVEKKSDEYLFEHLVTKKENIDKLENWKKTATLINKADDELKQVLSNAIRDFEKHLNKFGLDSNTVARLRSLPRAKRWLKLIVPLIDILAMLPFFIIGFLFNFLPYYVPKKICNSIFKDVCFINGTHFAMSSFLFIIAYIIYIIGLSFYVSPISVVFSTLIIAVCGIISYYYRRRASLFIKSIRYELAGDKKRREWSAQYKILSSEIGEWIQK